MSAYRFVPVAGTLLITLFFLACGGDSSGPVPVASVSLSPGSVPEMVAGETFQLSATPEDAEGNSLSGREITWNSMSTSVATVSINGLVTAVGVGSTTITAEAGGEQASTTVTVIPPPVASVELNPTDPNIVEGESVQLTATLRDQDGGVLTGRPITWSSSADAIAEVGSTGLVAGVSEGTADITATSEGVSGETSVTVSPSPVASVEVTPEDPQITQGGTVQLTATLRNAQGDELTGRQIDWSSSNEAAATVDGSGLVTGEAEGSADITATSEGQSGETTVTVSAASDVAISSISPSPLVEGASATISGQGFSSVVEENVVSIGGFPATVTSATPTELEIVVTRECFPAGNTTVEVTVVGQSSGVEEHPIEPSSTALDMQVGEQVILTGSELCARFDEGDSGESYLVGVQSTSETPSSLTPVRFRGQVPAAAAGGAPFDVASSAPLAVAPRPSLAGRAAPEPSNRWQRHRLEETRLRSELEREVNALRARGVRPATAAAAGAAGISASRIPDNLSVDDVIAVRVPDRSGNICTDYIEIDAIVRAVGANGVWLEDVDNPDNGFTSQDFQDLSDLFDSDIYATNVDYFGVPTDLDGNDRIAILTTKEVNISGGILGFVATTDFFPRSSAGCFSSNEGEIYYGKAPDPDGEFGSAYSVEDALLDAPPLIAHEVTHILQFGPRIMAGDPTLSQWEAEGQATFAEEVVGFAINGRTTGQNYGSSVVVEPGPDGILWHTEFQDLLYFFGYQSATSSVPGAPEQCTWLSNASGTGPCLGSRQVYGVPYTFLRWLSDQFGPDYPGGEAGMHRDLIDNALVGYANIENLVGEPINELIAQWAAMLYVDDRVSGMNPLLTLASWNIFDIANYYVETAHLNPYEHGFESFFDDVSVRAASTAYFRLDEDAQTAMSVRARNQSDGDLPAIMQMWVVRMQ